MTLTKDQFLDEYGEKLMDGRAALFIGAGLSVAAGYVDWKGLLRDIASDLNLTVDKEYDLIAVAQYHANERRSRSKLNEKLILGLTSKSTITENHKLIASLPISTVWTTNYDTLLEDAFTAQQKRVDVKVRADSVAQWRPRTDVVVFKMHGDVSEPEDAVLTKEDYETYQATREIFTIRLKGDLVSYTFLFLGFSFTDPNIDYILSRVKTLTGRNPREHYCILRRPALQKRPTATQRADHDYESRKLALRIDDLKRYHIQTVLIDEYSEITEILAELNSRAFKRNVFVSGSAVIGTEEFDVDRLSRFCRALGRRLIENDRNIISGYGFGIGSPVLVGALGSAGITGASLGERLILRPFPRSVDKNRRDAVYREWRQSMVATAGFAVFLSGNRYKEGSNTETEPSEGVIKEFDAAMREPLRCLPIPVGASGFQALVLWQRVMKNLKHYYPHVDVTAEMKVLGDARKSNEQLLDAVMSIIERA
jgi:hypothetical protein